MRSTNRTPFTVPLTGTERRFIQEQINLVMRQKGRANLRLNSTDTMDFEREVETAIAYFHKRGGWPPQCEVPTVALSALVGA